MFKTHSLWENEVPLKQKQKLQKTSYEQKSDEAELHKQIITKITHTACIKLAKRNRHSQDHF